jgi:nitrogen fixation NifU-like protein
VKNLRQLYHAEITRHASNPVGYRVEIDTTHRHEEYNAQCGDRVEVRLQVANGKIEAAAFDGEACQICVASASLLCEHVPGKDTGSVVQLLSALEQSLKSEEAPLNETLTPLLGVRGYPSRIQCATLPWKAATRALGRKSN